MLVRWEPIAFDSVFSLQFYTTKCHGYFLRNANSKVTKCQFRQPFMHCFFCMKVFCAAFVFLHLRFELLLVQEYWRICAHKMLVKLTTSFNKSIIKLQKYRVLGTLRKTLKKGNMDIILFSFFQRFGCFVSKRFQSKTEKMMVLTYSFIS